VKEKRFYFSSGFCKLDSFVAAAVVISSGDFFFPVLVNRKKL
jgi:hypothetical protein